MERQLTTLDKQNLEDKIYTIRGLQVILDADIAELYGVTASYLNRQVKRNIERFDENDFMFKLNDEEF